MLSTHRVLLIGSGLMTPPLLDYLLSFNDTHITVASNALADAQQLCKRAPKWMDAVYLDVQDATAVAKQVKGYNLVVSFIPPWLHMLVLGICVDLGINCVTSSYVSDDMMKLDAEAKRKGLVLLNECGLDPGIDIMGTMKIVDEAKERGFKVVSYESFCGGLPVAEQADNPLGYKFSWSPGAAIKASRNQAIFFKDGKRVVTNEPLKHVENRDQYSVAMKFEVYPNRDSTVFKDRFGMHDCETFIRGTIRFRGFSGVISAFHDLGLTSDDLIDPSVHTLRELALWRISKTKQQILSIEQQAAITKLMIGMSDRDKAVTEGVLSRVDVSYLKDFGLVVENYAQIVKSMKFLGFYDDQNQLIVNKAGKQRSCLDAFGDLMAARMEHTENDRDLVVMRHNFVLENAKKERWAHSSTWIESGAAKVSGGYSLMSKSVGVTAGIGARLVLEGKVKRTGVVTPMYKDVYGPILQILETKFGIAMTEESERPDGLPSSTRAKL